MIRILHIVSCLERGGTEAFIMNNYKFIDKNKFCFDFICFSEKLSPYDEFIRNMGGKVYYVKRTKNKIKFIKECTKIMRNYSVVHVHMNIANSWILLLAKVLKIPLRISHSHAVFEIKSEKLYKKLYRILQKKVLLLSANRYLACSEIAGKSLYGNYWDKKGILIKNGIDVKKFIYAQKSNSLYNKINAKGKYVFGNISRFDKNKNINFVVDVFGEIVNKQPNSLLLLGGVDGGELNYIKKKVKEKNLEDYVCFIGTRKDVEQCLKIIDIYIFPSLFEGFGISLLEAQAAGAKCYTSTSVPQSVDMGLGLVEFLDLSSGAHSWSQIIMTEMKTEHSLSNDVIEQKFLDNGYNINSTVKVLEKIYANEEI